MTKLQSFLVGLLVGASVVSCTKQTPQLPSNKITVDNSEAQGLLEVNKRLIAKEDSLLNLFVQKTDKAYVKAEMGFWYKIVQAGSGSRVCDKTTCSYFYKLLSIDGKIIKSGKEQIAIGKKEIVIGLEEGLKLLHQGDSVSILIPWYLAYGAKGDGVSIPAYTSVIYQVRILK